MARSIMVQGTCSSAGKSLLVTALCRIFTQDGLSVAPFKAQNMALNSYVTLDGLEMGRAQAVQAEAAGILPDVRMNPILMKPSSDQRSQIIVEGVPVGTKEAGEYYAYKKKLRGVVKRNYETLAETCDLVVIEGAGSPAEINLKKGDLVNMGMAKMADAPVILVGDIDRGGVFASLVGTMALLTRSERARVAGVVINKFRGDLALLEPGLRMVERRIGKPVLGVIPYMELDIEDEDSVTERFGGIHGGNGVDIAILKLPYISNFTDFAPFRLYPDLSVRYVRELSEFGNPDLVIIPGTKSTLHDLHFIKERGLERAIAEAVGRGTPLIGICGGFQMLGVRVNDPFHIESDESACEGLGYIAMETMMEPKKVTVQTGGALSGITGEFAPLNGSELVGYEIHMGRSVSVDGSPLPLFTAASLYEGKPAAVFGTYLHGLFENKGFTDTLLTILRKRKGLAAYEPELSYRAYKEREFDRLARCVRDSLAMDQINALIRGV